jgi:hypothetical protein
MNVERLHRILLDLKKDLDSSQISQYLTEVESHLQNQVTQPNQGTHQTNFVASLDKLNESLESSEYNSFSPGWKEIIEEISGNVLLGINLKQYIEGILAKNTITPAKALEEIKEINAEYQSFLTAITNTLSGFDELGIGYEELDPGECEFGYMIPRKFVENKLSSLKDEITELSFILNHVSEAVTGEKKEYEVKTISSSNFLLYIIIGLQVADVISKAAERILNQYKQILEIKILKNQLKEKGVPGTKTKGIDSHVNGIMEKEIKKIAKEVIETHYQGDNARKNELENGLVISLNKLANRIDNGFNIEVRVEPIDIGEKEEEVTDEEREQVELARSIQESAKNIEFLDTKGESILGLPENGDE